MARYVLAECNGHLSPWVGSRSLDSGPVGLTVSVLDTLNLHREVAFYRSEDYSGRCRTLSVMRERARLAAEADCAERNARHEALLRS